MEQNKQRLEFICPTFSTTDQSAETAARVAASSYLADFDADFEFDLVQTDISLADVALGEVLPVFNRDLSISDPRHVDDAGSVTSSDDDDDKLEGITTSAYCLWRSRKAEGDELGRIKKSGSSKSGSKRWKLLDLLRRSNSDGKGGFVFLTPKSRYLAVKSKTGDKGKFVFSSSNKRGAVKSKADEKGNFVISAHKAIGSAVEEFYVQNRASKEGQKKKSYLPYKKNLVGFFANVKGIGRS